MSEGRTVLTDEEFDEPTACRSIDWQEITALDYESREFLLACLSALPEGRRVFHRATLPDRGIVYRAGLLIRGRLYAVPSTDPAYADHRSRELRDRLALRSD